MDRTHAEKTAAADKSIGFDFQYYYFLNALLSLKTNETVGLEIKDDVHTDLNSDRQILVQLKHSVQKSASDEPINLTELDSDLWKTLSNWTKVISDKVASRNTRASQLAFISKTEFHLATNKSQSDRNEFLTALAEYKTQEKDIEFIIRKITFLRDKTKNDTIKTFINDVLSLEQQVLGKFLLKVHFELDIYDIVGRIHQSIKEKLVPEDRIQEVFERLDSNIREDNFIAIKNGIQIEISFADFYKRYRTLFDHTRSRSLPMHNFKPVFTGDFRAATFIRQLIKIGDLHEGEDEQIITYATEKITLTSSLQKWLNDGDIVNDEIKEFHAETIKVWSNAFRAAFRHKNTLKENEILEKAVAIVDALRMRQLRIDSVNLPIVYSNGELYHLSDIPEIWFRNNNFCL